MLVVILDFRSVQCKGPPNEHFHLFLFNILLSTHEHYVSIFFPCCWTDMNTIFLYTKCIRFFTCCFSLLATFPRPLIHNILTWCDESTNLYYVSIFIFFTCCFSLLITFPRPLIHNILTWCDESTNLYYVSIFIFFTCCFSLLATFPRPLIHNILTWCDESTNLPSKLFITISIISSLPAHFRFINCKCRETIYKL